MRTALIGLLSWGLLASVASAGEGETDEKERADESLRLCRVEAAAFVLDTGKPGGKLDLVPAPVLRWSNPVAGSIHGCVFLWTENGRPRAVASVYKWFDPFDHVGYEFHSLAEGALEASRGDRVCWEPTKAGIEFTAVPDADPPAESSTARLLQMRRIAHRFTASRTDREETKRELRLLRQPLHRYADREGGRLDGALFCFVEGTDPEAFLLIESRVGDGGPTWQYAAARMNSIQLDLALDGRDVWRAEQLPWDRVHDSSSNYFAFTDRKPRQR